MALAKPDGVTKVSEFANYPRQSDDISYGYEGSTFRVSLLTRGLPAVARCQPRQIRRWTTIGLLNSTHRSRRTGCGHRHDGVGFETARPGYETLLGSNLRNQMCVSTTVDPRYTTAYIRVPFNVADPDVFQN